MKLPKVYEPSQYEPDIYALWEKSEAFQPKSRGAKGQFSIVMPPPNANGNLHIGHALTNAVQDTLVRYHRMKGEAALYLPGADHAGFETWVVYEKELAKQGKTRFDFSREELYQQVWDFVQLNKTNFENQLRSLGASCDWSRFTFTLDDRVVNQAYKTFKKMWDEKLIYRGERLVNFCTFHGTSFSDIEVMYKEEKSKLWHIKYPLTDGKGSITVATTRPETMLGDVAVAVNPEDPRYKDAQGKTVKLPLTQREIPILADEMVDKEFGTGAVKITPAHDPNDYDVAERHDLPMMTVITHEGVMTHDVPEAYRGLDVLKARELVVANLKAQDLLESEEDYTHSVGHCYKCGTVIQPLLREQWFIDMKPLAKTAIKAIQNNKITFYPASRKEQGITYLEGIRDWNISRQIAWGIPIPAFQNAEDSDDWIYDERVDQEVIEVGGKSYRRDPDVFDTWFSSGQWPFITLGYPDSGDFKQLYPVSLMETGFDIFNQWVLRMIMLGLYVTGEVPFKNVYLHGLVLDEHGQKMSKSKGNVINPIDVVNQYGSDALRMGVMSGQTPGSNQPFGVPKVVAARNFCNKLWNVARFVEANVGEDFKYQTNPEAKTPADAWLLYKLQHTTEVISKHLDQYRFSEAAEQVYHLLWDDFADWYIEASKTAMSKDVLAYGLETILKLAHPFAPFVTEAIWQTLGWNADGEGDSLLITSTWPAPSKTDDATADEFEEIKAIVAEIRFIKGALKLSKGPALHHTGDAFVAKHAALIKALSGLTDVSEVKDSQGLRLTSTSHHCWLDIDQATANQFVAELKSQMQTQEKLVKSLQARLNNKAYVQNAPEAIVAQTKQQLEEAKTALTKVTEECRRFSTAS